MTPHQKLQPENSKAGCTSTNEMEKCKILKLNMAVSI
jgi:hypothetical protein